MYRFNTEGVKKTKSRGARWSRESGARSREKEDRYAELFSEQPPSSLRSWPSSSEEGSFRALRGAGQNPDHEEGAAVSRKPKP
jgi:hypothetical protein